MRRRFGVATTALLCLAALTTTASADIIFLKDGRKLEGETKWTPKGLEIRMKHGTVLVKKDQVIRVETTEMPRQEYERRLGELQPTDLEGVVELARFCIKSKFLKEARKLLLRVIDETEFVVQDPVDGEEPPNEEKRLEAQRVRLTAEDGLGQLDFHFVEGKWLPPEEFYPARGYTKKRGKWIKPKPKPPVVPKSEDKEPIGETATKDEPKPEDGSTVTLDPGALSGRVTFLLDVSGSMSIGGRFELAREKMFSLVEKLPEAVEFDVILFSHRQESLFGDDFLKASERVRGRIREHMRKKEVRLDSYTDIAIAMWVAFKRKSRAIILFTDGIATKGFTDPQKMITQVMRKREKAGDPPLFVFGVLEGEFMDKKVENKDAAKAFLRTLAEKNGGAYSELTNTDLVSPLARPGNLKTRAPEISVRYYKTRKKITSIRLGAKGFFPAFHMLVEDPALATGQFQIQEYPLDLKLHVESYDARGNQVDSPTEIPYERKGTNVFSTHYLRVTGPVDNQEDHGSHKDKRVYIKAFTGGNLQVVYTRAGQKFSMGVTIQSARPGVGD